MNLAVRHDDPDVTQLLNLVCSGVLTYAAVTRGGLTVARGLAYVARRAG